MPASLRSDGVRVHPGMPFGFPPEYAFSFAGIPSKRGITQDDLAELAGLNRTHLHRVESGAQSPKLRTLEALPVQGKGRQGSGTPVRHDLEGWINEYILAARAFQPYHYTHLRPQAAQGHMQHHGRISI
jgi:Helix-turn-helix